jgi:hypothetical protein
VGRTVVVVRHHVPLRTPCGPRASTWTTRCGRQMMIPPTARRVDRRAARSRRPAGPGPARVRPPELARACG